jgi:hypothetical protein
VGEARPAVPGFLFWDKEMAVGKWETCFWFSTFLRIPSDADQRSEVMAIAIPK